VKRDDRAAHAEARGNAYRFLSDIYLRPLSGDLLHRLVDREFLEELAVLFGEGAVADLKNFAATAHVDNDLVPLKQEYMNLFAVPIGRYVAPFEDVYRGETVDGDQQRGPLLGERAVAVKRIYRAVGAEMDQACKELPTHIGVELSFMAFLCDKEAEALRNAGQEEELLGQENKAVTNFANYREHQIRFLQDHLTVWFPQLSRSIQEKAKSPLYRGLAQITEAFLTQDISSLSGHNGERISF